MENTRLQVRVKARLCELIPTVARERARHGNMKLSLQLLELAKYFASGLSHKIRIPAIRIRECRFINKILRIRIPESLFSYCENKDCGNSDFMGQTAE